MIGNDKFVRLFGSVPAGDDEYLIQIVSEAVREGMAIVLLVPGEKVPLCTLTAAQRNKADAEARETARQIGDSNWEKRKHACGINHALTVESLTGTPETPAGDRVKVRAKVSALIRRLKRANGDRNPNIGVELRRSRMLVVDVDTDAEKAAFVRDWIVQSGDDDTLVPHMTVLSPGKRNVDGDWIHKNGGHYWFSIPDGVELPAGQGALKAESGWVAMWSDHQVLVPPSARAEGPYELVGQINPAPDWLIAKILHEAEARMRRAESIVIPDGTGDIDTWAFQTPWADILGPDGWTDTGLPDNCSCPIWTAPGPHGSPKSATAHDIGCTHYDSQTSPPLHVWTDNPPEFLAQASRATGSKTFTKLRYIAWRDYGGDQKQALVFLGFNQAPVTRIDSLFTWQDEPTEKLGKPKALAAGPESPEASSDDPFKPAGAGEPIDGVLEPEDGAQHGSEPVPAYGTPDTDSWGRVDLAALIGTEPAQPQYLPRTDGKFLIYPGLVHSIHGEPESGKSWIVQAECVRLAKLGETVLFLDFENDARTVVTRFLALGATATDLQFIDYRNPETSPAGSAAWNGILGVERGHYAIIVIDGMTDALALFTATMQEQIGGMGGNAEISYVLRAFRNRLARPIGAALVIIDHVAKTSKTRGRWAIGGQSKLAGLDGVAYVVDVDQPLGRGLVGVLKIYVGKDKPGFIRGIAQGFNSERLGLVGQFVMDATDPKHVSWKIDVPDAFDEQTSPAGDVRNEGLELLILMELGNSLGPMFTAKVKGAVTGKNEEIMKSLESLVNLGFVEKRTGQGKTGTGTSWEITESGRDYLAEAA